MNPCLVLLVDPDLDTRLILRASLEHAGYAVLDAATAEAGLVLAQEHEPDMVIGDFPMGEGDSLFSVRLRRDVRFRDTPILSVTTRDGVPDLTAARVGADEVLLKPVRPRVVVGTVARLLGRARV